MEHRRRAEAGLSLIEVLVATAVLCVAVVVALMVYDASRKAFAKSENATEQQESVRIAFDKLTTDLRMLGYNANPDGNSGRPDEQLEAALDHAVVFRADFDRSDPTASVTPETALAGGAFASVSTGNDEIVAYVLSKPDGTGPDSINFQADVRETPRDGVVEAVTINNVVLSPTAPPYTLYRVTLNNDARAYGTPGFAVRTPVADNVRDLSFTYYGAAETFKDPSPAIPETSEAKAVRNGLTKVKVSLVGMTRQPDLAYNDPGDPAAPAYRKFELKGDVTPRNARLKGIQDLNADVTPPSKPATPVLIPGHCGGLLATWASNSASEGVVQYRVSWGPGSGGVSGSRNVPGPPYFLDGLTTGASYTVWVQAQDAQGNVSPRSDPASATVANLNTPSAPTGLTTSTDQKYHVAVAWSPVTTNTANIPVADPAAPKIRDLAGYRLYWNFKAEACLTPVCLVANENVLGPSFPMPYFDTPLVACVDRYYWMTAVDSCGRESAPTAVARGRVANAGVAAMPPANVQAHFTDPSRHTAQVKWSPISRDVAGQAIQVERYEVYRSAPVDASAPPPMPGGAPVGVVYTHSFIDGTVPDFPEEQVAYYWVKGGDYCDNDSDYSAPARLECSFRGDVDFLTPRNGATVSGTVPISIAITGGADPSYTLVSIAYTYFRSGTDCSWTDTRSTSGTNWPRAWAPKCAGTYTITATVQDGNPTQPCTETGSIEVSVTNPPAAP